MLSHHRDITDFLARHGATLISVEPGGKHQKLDFSFKGRPYSVPVSLSSSDPNATAHAIQSLKKMLGEPVEPPAKETRRLEDMLPPASSRPTYWGGMAGYSAFSRGQPRVRLLFLLPPELVRSLDLPDRTADVARLGHDTWRLRFIARKAKYREPRVTLYGAQHIVRCGAQELVEGYDLFGVSRAEYCVIGDDVVVHLKETKPVTTSPGWQERKAERQAETAAPAPEPPKPEPPPQPAPAPKPPEPPRHLMPQEFGPPGSTKGDIVATDEYMRGVIRVINRLESISFHRLTKVRKENGESYWAWRAPDIRLEE